MMACFNVKQDILPNIMWIMDRLFQFTNFGIVSLIHQDFFITSVCNLLSEKPLFLIFLFPFAVQGKKNRDATLDHFRKHIEEYFIPLCRSWMVLFPEGGFLRKRKEASQRFAQKQNLPELNNVTLPRIGALKTAFSVLPPKTSMANNNSSSKPIENGNATQPLMDEEGKDRLRFSRFIFKFLFCFR